MWPSTPPPPMSAELAALTIASTARVVMSPVVTTTRPARYDFSAITLPRLAPAAASIRLATNPPHRVLRVVEHAHLDTHADCLADDDQHVAGCCQRAGLEHRCPAHLARHF